MDKLEYIKTTLNEDESALFSLHYINNILPNTKWYGEFHVNRLIDLVDNSVKSLKQKFNESKGLNERQVEDILIRPILESLGNTLRAQIPLNGDTMDFCVFEPSLSESSDGFAKDYSNVNCIIESKRYGRIENKYFISKEDNSDEIYQTLNYLRTLNLTLENNGIKNKVPYVVLTDGYCWRIYFQNYTHNVKEYESKFVEFNLEAIVNCENLEERNRLLKSFGIFFCKESLAGNLLKYQKESAELQTAVTVALKEQTYTALEYIATGIWRLIIVDESPLLSMILEKQYNIDIEAAKKDGEEKSRLLKLIYDESLVYLLRLLFVLFAEDRNLFNPNEIPKIIKGEGNILDLIIAKGKEIGEITDSDNLNRNDDVKLAEIYDRIDKKYNGGLFSKKKHPLLYGLNMDDTLFVNAVDNLCRVQVKKNIYSVDFSTVSVRELGGIYESLLEYKLAVIGKDMKELPSIINKKRVRHNVAKGDLYLINHAGERKATGSYYTPDLIVEHLVHTALVPKLEALKQAHKDNYKEFLKAVLDIKVCDPAMGSGHMIQAVYTRIISFVQQTFEEMHENGININWTTEVAYYVRTQVARKCIYGVDLNPIAVELAKLVLWMKVFRNDKPFEFFDYNLACGNSLIGFYEKIKANVEGVQGELFESQETKEVNIQSWLLTCVSHMLDMPRDTVQQVHEVEKYWQEQVRPLQHQIAFAYNVKLAQWLLPEKKDIAAAGYEELLNAINTDNNYVQKVLAGNLNIPDTVKALVDIDNEIRQTFTPLHWSVAYPHIAVKGGFDVILSNPPWDKVKANHNEFFSDYITGYADMEAVKAKKLAEIFMSEHPLIKKKWEAYNKSIVVQNTFYQDAYKYQVVKDSTGKTLKGDANLYKVFMEKIFTILNDGGTCGIVIPDNINIDNGCTGLRRMLLKETTIKKLFMFENRKKLFDIDSRYKFNVLTFVKQKPNIKNKEDNHFDAGFYWYDPIWLESEPDKDYIALDDKNKKEYHSKFEYSVHFIKKLNPDTFTIYEFKDKNHIDVFKKLNKFTPLGSDKSGIYVQTFREFDMTNDSYLFNSEGIGWPLLQGGVIHHYSITNLPVSKFVKQGEGEARLAKKWKMDSHDLPDRKYRIAWRSISQCTNNRSLISTVIPRGTFCGNSLNEAEIVMNGEVSDNPIYISGINVIMSSFCADFYVRQRIAMNVNAFIIKAIPVPRDMNVIKQLGEMALPLYIGDEYEAFRGDVVAITDIKAREKLIAKLDARVAILYGLSYEEYQAVLATFPLVDEDKKKRCLLAYKDWTFEM